MSKIMLILITYSLLFESFIYSNALCLEKTIGQSFCQQVSSSLEWRGRHKSK